MRRPRWDFFIPGAIWWWRLSLNLNILEYVLYQLFGLYFKKQSQYGELVRDFCLILYSPRNWQLLHEWWRRKTCTTKINVSGISAVLIFMCLRIQISAKQQLLAVSDNWVKHLAARQFRQNLTENLVTNCYRWSEHLFRAFSIATATICHQICSSLECTFFKNSTALA